MEIPPEDHWKASQVVTTFAIRLPISTSELVIWFIYVFRAEAREVLANTPMQGYTETS